MKLGMFVKFIIVSFVVACGVLIWDSGLFDANNSKAPLIPLAASAQQAEPTENSAAQPAAESEMQAAAEPLMVAAVSASSQTVVLGEVYPDINRTDDITKFKFKVELTTQGAAISSAQLSEFSDRDPKSPKPLRIINPVISGKPVYSCAAEALYLAPKGQPFAELAFPLDKLQWEVLPGRNANQAIFAAQLGKVEDGKLIEPMIRITRTYTVQPGSYDLDCQIAVENLTDNQLQAQLRFGGAVGIAQEGMVVRGKTVSQDIPKLIAAFMLENQSVETRLQDAGKIYKNIQKGKPLTLMHDKATASFIWAAITNKYFAAILRPVPAGDDTPAWASLESTRYFGTDETKKGFCSFAMRSQTIELDAKGSPLAAKTFAMQLYLGPKDKRTFEDNPTYNRLAYFQTIDMQSCCCPAGVISPMAFGIVWLMNTMYNLMGPLGNYGIVIMILVCVVRLLLHPLTKSSQVQMMRMQKLGPRIQEVQRKYADNKAEMQKQTMAIYREQGITPVMSMLPMFLQMPIWIALWTAVSVSIDLRGQGFMPFWITDLSAPDALFRFGPVAIPLLGDIGSLNLLPLLMGVVMYLQMKLTPTSQPSATASPEMAQQQKMMAIMFPVLFPIMLYNGPSGVNLYIMSSMAAGVVEQWVIRKHLKEKQEQEEAGTIPTTAKLGKVKKKKPKPMFKWDR